MKLLMHLCCSNCGIAPLQEMLVRGHDVTAFWFNPNIHPYTEYRSRLESVVRLGRLWRFGLETHDDYGLEEFLRRVLGHDGPRCEVCYAMRLERTAETARRMGLEGFTTSLLASPYQKFDMIQKAGKEAAQRHGIMFFGDDFRRDWHASRPLVRELGLYRQQYCGCIFSEKERYLNERNRKSKTCP